MKGALGCNVVAGQQLHAVAAIDIVQEHLDRFVSGGGQRLAHKVGVNGHLTMAPIDQAGQPHRLGAAIVMDGIEGGADGAATVDHVVY